MKRFLIFSLFCSCVPSCDDIKDIVTPDPNDVGVIRDVVADPICEPSIGLSGLPVLDFDFNCEATPAPKSLEEWTVLSNSVFYGTVQNVVVVEAPLFVVGEPLQEVEVESCTKWVEPVGIRVTLKDVTTLFGEPVGQFVDVTFGYETTEFWATIPFRNDCGELDWRGEHRIAPDLVIGGTFTPIAGQWTSATLSGLFEVVEGGVVRHQFENGQLCDQLPVEFEGRDIDEYAPLFESLAHRPLDQFEPSDDVRRRFLSSACASSSVVE